MVVLIIKQTYFHSEDEDEDVVNDVDKGLEVDSRESGECYENCFKA